MPQQIIHIQPAAPRKPAPGQACNGCGVCCLVEPCPLGQLLSRRRHGACAALRWDTVSSLYRCGALSEPEAVLRAALATWPARWMRPGLLPLLRWQARRWIAAGQGCDCTLEPEATLRSDGQSAP